MIVLLGSSGYIGGAFREALQVHGHPYVTVGRRELNRQTAEQLTRLLEAYSPAFVINAAGMTGRPNVDACELDKTDCLWANAVLPGELRRACEALGVPWGHVSSGCLYTGCRPNGRGFQESDPPNFSFRQNNCSFYSGCKALGEELLAGAERCYIWRIRMPFDHRHSPKNFLSKLLVYPKLLDVRNSLSHLDECVQACVECWTKGLDYGIYHLTNTGSVTTRDVTEMLYAHGIARKAFSFYASEEEFYAEAKRAPRSNCVLDNSKALSAGLPLSSVRDALERALARWTWSPDPEPAISGVQ